MDDQDHSHHEFDNSRQWRDRIHAILSIYPIISPAMLQVGLGTSCPPAMWKPVLRQMIEAGVVTEGHVDSRSPSGRATRYKTLTLVSDLATLYGTTSHVK